MIKLVLNYNTLLAFNFDLMVNEALKKRLAFILICQFIYFVPIKNAHNNIRQCQHFLIFRKNEEVNGLKASQGKYKLTENRQS